MGFRPTLGRYPSDGLTRISGTRDTVGPMARSVADVALLDAVLADEHNSFEPANLKGLRLGVPRQYFYDDLEPLVAQRMENLLDAMRDAGAVLVEADLPRVGELNQAVSFPVVLFETGALLREYLAKNLPGGTLESLAATIASPDVRNIFAGVVNGDMPQAAYRQALDHDRPLLKTAFADYFAGRRVEAIVFPHHSAHRPAAQRNGRDGGTERETGSHLSNLHPQHRPRQQRRDSRFVHPACRVPR